MMNKLNKKKKKGFTLIELIIVIAILAILAAVAVPQFGKVRENANKSTDISNAKTIANAISTLLAEDKLILPPSGSAEIVIDNSEDDADSLSSMSSTTGKSVDKTIVDYLQSLPTAKLAAFRGENFIATITSDAKVTITVKKDKSTAQVYPEAATTSIYYQK